MKRCDPFEKLASPFVKRIDVSITMAGSGFVSHRRAKAFATINIDQEICLNEIPFYFDELGKVVLEIPSNNCVPPEPVFKFVNSELKSLIYGYLAKEYQRIRLKAESKSKTGVTCEQE